MKKLYFLTVCILITSFAFSQAYKPMLKENKTWEVYEDAFQNVPNNNHLNKYFLKEDSLYNGVLYHKVQKYNNTSGTSLPNCCPAVYDTIYQPIEILLREDTLTRKIWGRTLSFFCFPLDTTEKLIYDFSLNVGDTLFSSDLSSLAGCQNVLKSVVDSIGLITLNNNEVTRIFYYSAINFFDFGMSPSIALFIIEGVGGNSGFFRPFINEFESTVDLLCVNDSGVNLFSQTFLGNNVYCGTILSTNDKKEELHSFELYPNPNNGEQITITGKGLNAIKIYNIQGQLIKTITVTKNNITVNLTDKPKGIYFVKAQFSNGSIATQKLVTH